MAAIRSLNLRFTLLYYPCIVSLAVFFGLLLTSDSVSAQTSTPTSGVATSAPVSTPAPGGGLGGDSVILSFVSSPGGCEPIFGVFELGLGWQSDGLGKLGLWCRYPLDEVTRVVVHYASTESGTLGIQFSQCDPGGCDPSTDAFTYSDSQAFADCPDECTVEFITPETDITGIAFSITPLVSGTFVLRGLDFAAIPVAGDFDTENGCPVLDLGDLNELDPGYFARCSRCFVPPTAVRSNQLTPVFITPVSTATGSFSIPILVSGTPVTLTPGGALPGTFLPPPTFTPGASATPGGNQYDFDFTANDGGWTVSAAGFDTTLGHYVSTGWQSNFAVGTEFVDGYQGVGIRLHLPSPTAVYGVYAEYVWSPGSTDRPGDHPNIVFVVGSAAVLNEVPPGASPAAWVGTQTGISDILVQGVSGFNDAGSDPGGSFLITRVILTLGDAVLPTATPTGTAAPTSTFSPWIATPDLSPASCEVPIFRDSEPIAVFDTVFSITDYQCYDIVPDIHLEFGREDLRVDVEGVRYCITWFQLPVIEIFQIQVALDWLLVILVAWLIQKLSSL